MILKTRSPLRLGHLWLSALLLSASACASTALEASPTAIRSATSSPLPTATTPPRPTDTPAPTSTPDPYQGLTIKDLASAEYGGGAFTIHDQWRTAAFTRVLFSYPSDGRQVHGFANLPFGKGPFPVLLVLHGYISPDVYQTLTYTTHYADQLAEAGFLVFHPNYRNYPPSQVGPNPFRIGYAVDVLNLLALIRDPSGSSILVEKADPSRMGLFGHSMGGGIALRVITVDPEIEAAVLYGSMSGDEALNFQKVMEWSGGRAGWEELNTPAEDLERISPIYHLDRIKAAVSIHHGEADQVVPPEWSEELCRKLGDLDKRVECFSYPGQPHTFAGQGEQQFMERVLAFFQDHLGQ